MITVLLGLIFGTFVTEDLTCIAAGVLVAQGTLSFPAAVLACLTGIVVGDLLLYAVGRFAGSYVTRFVAAERLKTASEWIVCKGPVVVILSRFTPGLRLPSYVASGLLRAPFWRFAGYFVVASGIWTPLLVGATALFGAEAVSAAFQGHTIVRFAVAVAAAAAGLKAIRVLSTYARRRRVVGFLKRKIRWEFWPAWAAYLPLVPYFLYLACRHRSLTVFTLANPGMMAGGLVGESKSEILRNLTGAAPALPAHSLIEHHVSLEEREAAAFTFIAAHNLTFPVVLKPDIGERGSGVAIIRTTLELQQYLENATGDTIIQEYVPGAEFGVFYVRYPNEAHGRIVSITEKHFPEVTGDGLSTLERLIVADDRAVCMFQMYARVSKRPMSDVPAAGERIRLVELGSHCRGAIFLDATRLRTPELEAEIDRISRCHPGFYFGRFDIRVPSPEALREARDVKVIELNGVSSEATHIYDPAVSLWDAYRTMFRQWRIAFEIGGMNRDLGYEPLRIREVAKLVVTRRAAGVQANVASAQQSACERAPQMPASGHRIQTSQVRLEFGEQCVLEVPGHRPSKRLC